MCLECSGQHRSLGTHVSFVRSVKMDSWTDDQIKKMKLFGGNDSCNRFLSKYGIDTENLSIREKYDSPQGQLYQQVLKARMECKPEPTELPPETKENDENQPNKKNYDAIRSSTGKGGSVGAARKPMEGFGSSPHPAELKREKRHQRRDRRRKIMFGAGAAVIGAVGMAVGRKKRTPSSRSAVSLSCKV